jgi:hypothetical protein
MMNSIRKKYRTISHSSKDRKIDVVDSISDIIERYHTQKVISESDIIERTFELHEVDGKIDLLSKLSLVVA